ncbi:MAG: ABC transporter permease [Planctomycetota bacterium]
MSDLSLREVTYAPGSGLADPGRLAAEMWRDLKASRGLAWRLVVRNLSAQYRGAALGWIWAFLPPLAAAGTFIILQSTGVIETSPAYGMPYPVFVFLGTILWQSFVDSVQKPLQIVNASRAMLTKINFPREALLLAGIGEVLFNTLVRFSLLVGVMIVFTTAPAWTAPLALLGFGTLIMIGTMIGVLLTPLGILYKDIQQAITMLMGFLLFLTPVGWAVPQGNDAGVRGSVEFLNPAAAPLMAARDWLIVGSTPYWPHTLVLLVIASGLTLVGWVLYRLAMPIIIERIGS